MIVESGHLDYGQEVVKQKTSPSAHGDKLVRLGEDPPCEALTPYPEWGMVGRTGAEAKWSSETRNLVRRLLETPSGSWRTLRNESFFVQKIYKYQIKTILKL